MNYVLALIVALCLTIGWQSSVIASDNDSNASTEKTQGETGKNKGKQKEPECD